MPLSAVVTVPRSILELSPCDIECLAQNVG